jgi:D-proline reductase (dithiol) PrdB
MQPFTENDLSFRKIPDHEETRLIHFIPGHYDTSKAAVDANILFPLDRIHDLVAAGEIGQTTEYHISMGLTTELRKLKEEVSWTIAREVCQTRPDVVVLTGG